MTTQKATLETLKIAVPNTSVELTGEDALAFTLSDAAIDRFIAVVFAIVLASGCAVAQNQPMSHWGNAATLDANTVSLGFEAIGKPGASLVAIPFAIPPATRVTHIQGVVSFKSACASGDLLVVWRFSSTATAYATIVKFASGSNQGGGAVNYPIDFTIPVPVDSPVAWLTLNPVVRNCPASAYAYYSNNVPFADAEVQAVMELQ